MVVRAGAGRSAPPIPIDAPLAPRWEAADLALVGALTLLWLAIALFLHPIGDHYTESDFYGAYARGARALLAGRLDPARYGIYGPLYEWLLAGAAAIGLDLFFAAKLFSVVSAGAALACVRAIAAPLIGRGGARWAVLATAITPVFTRYAYSATTDMPAAALSLAAIALLLNRRSRRAVIGAGVLVALATLTRYQAIALLPAGVLALAWRGQGERGAVAARRSLGFALALLVTLAPWCGWSIARGYVPGRELVSNYRFYAAEDGSRNLQDRLATPAAATASAPAESPLRLWPRRALEHAREDEAVLLGPLFALAVVLGALSWLALRRRAGAAALAIVGACLYLGLVPAFYSDRYRLALLPLYAIAAAALWPALAGRGRLARAVVAIGLAAALAPVALRSFELQRRVATELPRDVLAVAPALAAEPGDGALLARKGHLGYYGGRRIVPFPRTADLADLAATARAGGARWLYYSWYEARLRPEFLALLDTTRALPGLERVATSAFPAGVLYRIGPGFGAPGWFGDPRERAVSEARAAVWALEDSAAAHGRAVLAADAYLRGDFRRAVDLAKLVRQTLPGDTLATWVESYGEARLAGLGDTVVAPEKIAKLPRVEWLTGGTHRPETHAPHVPPETGTGSGEAQVGTQP